MDEGVTLDAFYGGRLMLRQAAKGHRSGTDAVLLAAAVPRDFSGLCYDVGSGVGVAGLGVALACPRARVSLLENDPRSVALAEINIADNALGGSVSVVSADLFASATRRAMGVADLIVTNPPFHAVDRVRASPDARRHAAHILPQGVTAAHWIGACLGLLAPKGTLILVHAAAALPAILAAMEHLGAITALAIHPREGAPAKRVMVRGTAGSRAPFTIAAPLTLHEGEGFTDVAACLHRGEAALAW